METRQQPVKGSGGIWIMDDKQPMQGMQHNMNMQDPGRYYIVQPGAQGDPMQTPMTTDFPPTMQGGNTPVSPTLPDMAMTRKVDPRALQEALASSEGDYIQAWFLIGTQNIRSAMGTLVNVGESYLTLLDPCSGVLTTFDLYSLKAWSVYPANTPDIEQLCRTRLFRSGFFGAYE